MSEDFAPDESLPEGLHENRQKHDGELLPCPFCGGDVGQNAYWDYWCTNPLCAIHHVAFRTKERWNTRTPDTSAKVDVERAGDFVTRLGMDGRLWAKETNAMFPQIPEADLLGWCCNMIMAGYDNARGAPINGDHAQYLIDSAALQSPRSDTSAKPLLCPPDEGYYCEKHERGSRELGTACSECYRESLATDTSAVELVREYMSLSARAKAGLLHVGILNGVENWAADCDKLETKAEQWLKKQGA